MRDHFLFLLRPRFTITLPPAAGLPKDSTPFEEESRGRLTSFYFVDSDLNRLRLVPPKSSTLAGFSPRTESKVVALNEFLLGKLIFLRELGRALISGKKLSPDFIIGSEVLEYSSEDLYNNSCFYKTGLSTLSFLARSLFRSKPPPVSRSFLAFLSSSFLFLSYYCYLRCFL